nr:hypothetical protein CFP56_65624 [Quercus suber]
MHSTEINAHVKALRTLCKQKASNPEEADTLVMIWVSEANKDGNFLAPPSRKGKKAARLLLQAVTAVYIIGDWLLFASHFLQSQQSLLYIFKLG